MMRIFCWMEIFLLAAGSLLGQPSQSDKVRAQVQKIGVLSNITVVTRDGRELYGSVRTIDTQEFTLNEVDQNREIAVRYDDVKNVRAGYGTSRAINGRRIHPHTKLIVSLAVIGGLVALVFIAVASDHS